MAEAGLVVQEERARTRSKGASQQLAKLLRAHKAIPTSCCPCLQPLAQTSAGGGKGPNVGEELMFLECV